MSEESITQQHYEKIGRFIYGFQRHADPDKLRAAVAAGELAPDAAERAAALVRRFDKAMEGLKHASANSMPRCGRRQATGRHPGRPAGLRTGEWLDAFLIGEKKTPRGGAFCFREGGITYPGYWKLVCLSGPA